MLLFFLKKYWKHSDIFFYISKKGVEFYNIIKNAFATFLYVKKKKDQILIIYYSFKSVLFLYVSKTFAFFKRKLHFKRQKKKKKKKKH